MSLSYLPDLTFTAGFASGSQVLPLATNVDQFSVARGSSSPSLTGLVADAGTLSTTFENYIRALDPTFTTGPYYPDIVPGVPLTLTATWAATSHPVFQGNVTQWPQLYPNSGFLQTVDLQAADAIRNLARAQLSSLLGRKLTGARIADILAAINYAGASTLNAGTAFVPQVDARQSASSAQSLVADAVNAEFGYFWVDPSGTLRFLDRNGLSLAGTVTTPQAIFGDGPGELPIADVIVQFDDTRIVNDALLNYNQTGAQATAEDLTSQGKPWGKISWQQNFNMASGALARSFVFYVVQQYKDPTLRFSQLIVDPLNDPTNLWPVVLTLDIGQRITIKVTPKGGGARIIRDVFIRGIQHDYQSKTWKTTYTLDDANLISVTAHYDDGTLYNGAKNYSF